MRLKLRPEWFELQHDGFDLNSAGVYEWRVGSAALYVGKAKVLRRRLRDYPNNVRRMLQGLPWHGDVTKPYRLIHVALRSAYEQKLPVVVRVVENCDPDTRSERERHWIARRREEARQGGPPVLNSN
jgi:uncharacterized protein YfaQ (DUF2300 family)